MLTNKFLSKGNKVRGGLYQDMTFKELIREIY